MTSSNSISYANIGTISSLPVKVDYLKTMHNTHKRTLATSSYDDNYTVLNYSETIRLNYDPAKLSYSKILDTLVDPFC